MEVIRNVITGLLNFLPDNPFTDTLKTLGGGSVWWAYVGYFVPVDAIVAMFTGWSVCMGIYYAWKIVKKWLSTLGKG